MKNLLLVVGLGLAVAVGLGGCSDEPATKINLSDRGPAMLPMRPEAITYAYLPQYAPSVSHRRHRRLLEHLREETGLALRQVFPSTFDEHLKMVIRGEIDISFSNPFVYIQMAEYGVRAFARIVEDSGGADFRGQLITRTDNVEITSIADLRGKRWLAVDQDIPDHVAILEAAGFKGIIPAADSDYDPIRELATKLALP